MLDSSTSVTAPILMLFNHLERGVPEGLMLLSVFEVSDVPQKCRAVLMVYLIFEEPDIHFYPGQDKYSLQRPILIGSNLF